jgi:pullulanase/glycogen debranching enzyme
VKQWIEEYKIDGLRWDLTKVLHKLCTANDENCTNSYQQDRVDVLKEYADYSWSLDPTHYAILNIGSNFRRAAMANYKLNETPSKGNDVG